VEVTEIRKLAALEDRLWWYAERRELLARSLRRLGTPGRALDIGAAGGGNTRVLRAHGWQAAALDYSADGTVMARERGVPALRADARRLPVASGALDLVMAFDVLEHIQDDVDAAAEILRVLRPGGTALIAVPADMKLWSAHDVAVGHVRRYDREGLRSVVEKAGLVIDELWSWNVLLRPVAALRRRVSKGSDLDDIVAPVNLGLRAVVAAERYLPLKSLPGVTLMLRAHRPAS
jgi:SAM-dependent methyltransferase